MAIEISKEEFEKRFGELPKTSQKVDYGNKVKQSFNAGVNKVKEALMDDRQNPISKGLKIGSGILEAGSAPIAPVFEPVGKAVDWAGQNLGKNPLGGSNQKGIVEDPIFQKFANSKAGEFTSRRAEDVANFSNIAGAVGGSRLVSKTPATVGKIPSKVGNLTRPVKNIAQDVIPNVDRVVNSNITKALDLTQGDASTFYQSVGEDVGRFIADRNLIRANKSLTTKAIKDHFDTNYKQVRTEIDKVKTSYKPSQVPRYTEALKSIKQQIDDVPGLQKEAVDVDKLLAKKDNIILNDVQKVKELLDDYYSMYKRTGEVKDTVRAQGLDNIRSELKDFIEVEVKNNTGADIGAMNKNVSGAKQLLNDIEARSTRGLTKANIRMGDLATLGAGSAISFPLLGPLAPLGGAAALFVKKVFESPAVMLRISKMLDNFSDAKKAKIKTELESGNIPQEFQSFVKKPVRPRRVEDGVTKEPISSEDRLVMEQFIDNVRLKKPTNNELELAASRIAERHGLKMPKNRAGLADEFDKYITDFRSKYAPKFKGRKF